MTDPITDMLNRIRNSQAVDHETVVLPFSNLKYEIAKILKKQGFIAEVDKKGKKQKKSILITLKYDENKKPVINNLKRISKPSQRLYISYKDIRPVKEGWGIAIISTPQGLMTAKEARKKKLGGEILCEIS